MKRSNIIFYFLYISLLVDSLNGFLIYSYSVSISPFYKAIALALCLLHLKSKARYIGIILVLAIFILAHTIQTPVWDDLQKSFDWLSKLLFIYLLYQFMRSSTAKTKNNEKIITLAKISFSVIAVNIFLGNLGFGYAQYSLGDQTYGTRGFFYAGNELSVALACSSGIVMISYFEKQDMAKYLVFSILAIAVAALTTMKASLLSIGVLFILMPLLKNKKASNVMIKRATILIFALGAIGFAVYYALYQVDQISRLTYFYEKNGLVSLIFSLRNIWAMQALGIFNDYTWTEMLFGGGLQWTDKMPHGGIVEIDIIDTLLTYGLVGVVLVYGFLSFILYKVHTNKNNPGSKAALLLILLITGISITAGHVIFSGVSAPLIAAALVYGLNSKGPLTKVRSSASLHPRPHNA
ncbi:O-antigen ligase family protein [Pseudomonas gregormendelii]